MQHVQVPILSYDLLAKKRRLQVLNIRLGVAGE